MTIALYAQFTGTPGNESTVRQLIGDFALQVRSEPGNLRFDPHETAPGSFFVYELYRDRAAFDSHLAEEHGRVFNDLLGPIIHGGASHLTMLTPVGELPH